MRINHNSIASATIHRTLTTESAMGKSLEKLSSGYRINRAADDAAGLVISQKLRAQISSLHVATRNTQDAVNTLRIVEGTLSGWNEMFGRMRDLAVQYQNEGTLDATAQAAITDEWTQLLLEVGHSVTNFTSLGLFQGTDDEEFQIGVDAGDRVTVKNPTTAIAAATAAIGAFAGGGLSDPAVLEKGLEAIAGVNAIRAYFGAFENRLESAVQSLRVMTENLTASESRIRDTDMAAELVSFTRHQILLQAGTAMLAQANQLPQATLRLLQ